MKFKSKICSVILAGAMTASLLAGCNGGGSGSDAPLVIAQSAEFSQRFTTFFVDSVNDQEVLDLVDVPLIALDRVGAVIYKGIKGEKRSFNGTEYTYYGPADVTVTVDETTGETKYNYKLRENMKFSDGKPITADDVIFSLYAYCDNSYDGAATIGTLPIKGIKNYKTQTTDEVYEKYSAIAVAALEAGAGFEGTSDVFTAEQYANYYECYTEAWKNAIQNIVNYVSANYVDDKYTAEMFGRTAEETKNENLKVAYGMVMWGFAALNAETNGITGAATGKEWDLVNSFPTLDDYYNECYLAYEGSLEAFCEVELVDPDAENPVGDAADKFINTFGSKDESMGGQSIDNIAGIQKLGKYEVEVTLTKFDAAAIYRMAIAISPLHYYGDAALYDYDNNKFGFTRGDLSAVHSKDTVPMGAGMYKFVKYENKVVYLEANDNYYLGAPKIKNVQMKESADADIIPGIVAGSADLGAPSVSVERLAEIKSDNSNGEVEGDVLVMKDVDYLGYGYIGLSSKNISVGGVSDSEASKNLRKGLSTVLAAYRDLTVDSFYGGTASVINYPISNTSWAAPQKTDTNYRVAYSTDVNGNDIYTSDMDADARYAAAKKAALGFFEAAGYTLNADKTAVTQAPDGASLSYTVTVGAKGQQDHPSFALLTSSKGALAEIGITLEINDVADTNMMWDPLKAEKLDIWCAAWGATADPDMHQIYHSSNKVGVAGGTGMNYYGINDPTLDDYILKARESSDDAYRKEIYKNCLDIIMDWGVEIPVYQRKECYVFSAERINLNTITPDITSFWSWARELYKLQMK